MLVMTALRKLSEGHNGPVTVSHRKEVNDKFAAITVRIRIGALGISRHSSVTGMEQRKLLQLDAENFH